MWHGGYVEHVQAPEYPIHLLAQQTLALSLQENGIAPHDWKRWVGGMPGFAALDDADVDATFRFMLERGVLFDDQGVWSIGVEGQAAFGRRHFIDLLSAFTSEPLFTIKHGQLELGRVHHASFAVRDDRPPVILLAGRPWVVTHVDWNARVAFVEPTKEEGRSRWLGSGAPLRFGLCQAIARVLAGETGDRFLSKRGMERATAVRRDFQWLEPGRTALVTEADGRQRWWTFAGQHANAGLAQALRANGVRVERLDNFSIGLIPSVDVGALEVLQELPSTAFHSPVDGRAIEGLKFNESLPEEVAREALARRLTDTAGVECVVAQPGPGRSGTHRPDGLTPCGTRIPRRIKPIAATGSGGLAALIDLFGRHLREDYPPQTVVSTRSLSVCAATQVNRSRASRPDEGSLQNGRTRCSRLWMSAAAADII